MAGTEANKFSSVQGELDDRALESHSRSLSKFDPEEHDGDGCDVLDGPGGGS